MLDLEKAEEPEIKLPISTGSSKKQKSYRDDQKEEKSFCIQSQERLYGEVKIQVCY